ncbi:MAG: M24 family metallopeptidase [Geminicoccaceae bacterium]|nr:MAG: M24 family metallopeptidase [Geminicoccaceae bacterium]
MTDLPRTRHLPNGPKRRRLFEDAEIEGRLAKLRLTMEQARLDACLFTSIHNVNYFDDFVYCSFGRAYGLVVDHDASRAIVANIDFGWPWRRGYADTLTYTDWQKDNFYHAAATLLPKVKRLGIEFDHVTLEARTKLEAALPGVELVDVAPATMRQRMLKSPAEIALIEAGANVADIGGAACVAAIHEGVPEYEVALASTQAMVRAIAERFPHAELMDTWTWFQSGLMTDGAHNPVTTRRVQKGDILSLNCFPMISGYYTALERTLFFDHVDDASVRIWEANVAVHRRGLELIRPGLRCCDIAHELNAMFQGFGLLDRRTFGYGHSFGTLSHYYGREAGLELREDVETVLQPGMVVSMEPMVTIPEGEPGAGGYREHDILVVTETGAQNVTGFPFGPEHNVVAG